MSNVDIKVPVKFRQKAEALLLVICAILFAALRLTTHENRVLAFSLISVSLPSGLISWSHFTC